MRFSTRMVWRKVWIEDRTLCGMDGSEKWMTRPSGVHTLYQTTTIPKWMFSQKLFFKSSLLLYKFCSPTSSDDLCFLFCPILLICSCFIYSYLYSILVHLALDRSTCWPIRARVSPHYLKGRKWHYTTPLDNEMSCQQAFFLFQHLTFCWRQTIFPRLIFQL